MSIFTRIAAGEIPGHIVYEDDRVLAVLDINPRAEGHTLVIPRLEVDQLFDLPKDEYAHLWSVARTIGTALRDAMGCERIYTFVIGDEVPHAHIHLIPSNLQGPIPFPALDAAAADRLGETAQLIRETLA
jgi:histidine triad (HIT) family protein